ncbi:putative reverse transcriptase domain-containing protein, partial [Tanacetum coccineum]
PEEDPEEYEDDETEDGPVDYPMDGGEDEDDDDDDSPGDDADFKDEDEEDEDAEDEEEEEHLALADSAVVVPTVELVSPPEGTKPVIPPPSTDITTTGARITVRLQASISLPPEAEVERLLAMPTPPPSPPISLSPPSAGERLARCMAPSAHSSPPPVPSPLLPSSGCPTQIQTLRIASTQALVDVVTAALPSPPLPPLPPSLYIPPPVDRRDDIPESERPPRKRSCLFALGSRYEVGESSTARPTGGRGIDYGFVSTVDAEARRQGIREVGYGIRDNWVDPAEAVPEIAHMTMGETDNKRKADDTSRNNHSHQQQPFKRQNVAKVYNMGSGEKKAYDGSLPKSSGNTNVANTQKGNGANPKGNGCFECGAPGHFKRDCPKLKNKDGGNGSAQGWVYAVGNAEKKGNASRDPDSNVVTKNSYDVELADGKIVGVDTIMRGCTLNFLNHPFNIDLMLVELGSFDVIIGMDWLRRCHAVIMCDEKLVRIPYGNETLIFRGNESNNGRESQLTIISCLKDQVYMAKGCQIFLAQISTKKEEENSEGKQLKDVPIVQDFSEVFLEDLPGLPPAQPMEYQIDLILGVAPIA